MAKKSKAQLEEERLAREEEERKAKAAEEKRLAEEAERKRLEDIRIQEERKLFREGELARLLEEQKQWKDDQETRSQRLVAEENHEAKKNEWEAYRNPTDDFESMGERDMNTFLSLTEESEVLDLKEAFEVAKTIQQVGESIDKKWSDAVLKRRLSQQASAEDNASRCLRQMTAKIDKATAHFLRTAETKVNDRSELLVEECSRGVSLGIWGSYADIRPIRKSVQFDQLGVQIDVPKQILQHDANFLFKVTRIALDPFSIQAYRPGVDASADSNMDKYVVGDLVTVDIVKQPSPSFNLRAKKWTIRDRSAASQTLQKSAYPSSVNCKAIFKVPEEVLMSDDVTVKVWDEEQKLWSDDGISDYQYIEATNSVQFYFTVVGTFALVKSRSVDFPYKKWSLQPVRTAPSPADPNSVTQHYETTARFSLQTPRGMDVVVDIVGTKVKLVRPNTKFLADLIGVEMATGSLLKALLRRGVNLLPVIPSDPELLKKDPLLEDCVLRHISRSACSLDFEGSTAWNDAISRHQIGVHSRESTTFAGGLDVFNMECILGELDAQSTSHKHAEEVGVLEDPGVKFSLVVGNEYGKHKQQYFHGLRPDETTHYELKATMTNRVMPETSLRIREENVQFEKAVYEFLSLVRPFSFS